MPARDPVRTALEALIGVALCAFAVPVGIYGLAFTAGVMTSEPRCSDGYYWCPTGAENTAIGVLMGLGVAVAVGLLVLGGARLVRAAGPRRPAWLLAGAGVLLTFGLAYAALAYAGAQGAFS